MKPAPIKTYTIKPGDLVHTYIEGKKVIGKVLALHSQFAQIHPLQENGHPATKPTCIHPITISRIEP